MLGIKGGRIPRTFSSTQPICHQTRYQRNQRLDGLPSLKLSTKRLGRKIAELKFRITQSQAAPRSRVVLSRHREPIRLSLLNSSKPTSTGKLRCKSLNEDWDFVNPEKLPPPGTYPDFLMYVAEKIEISHHVAEVKNRGGFLIEAIRENYQNSEVQKARELRAEKVREKELQELTEEFKIKRHNHPSASRPRRPETR